MTTGSCLHLPAPARMVCLMTQDTTRKTLLCYGYGYTARALAKILPRNEWHIIGTTRDTPDHSDDAHVELITWPGDVFPLQNVTHILLSISPSEAGDPVLNALGTQIAALPSLEWVGYLSTTAVYGDHDGGGWMKPLPPRHQVSAEIGACRRKMIGRRCQSYHFIFSASRGSMGLVVVHLRNSWQARPVASSNPVRCFRAPMWMISHRF